MTGTGMKSLTSQTITNMMYLQEKLASTRLRGYAIDNQLVTEGIICVAAPIYDVVEKPVAAISITSVSSMLQKRKMDKLGTLIADNALFSSRKIGFIKEALF